MAIGLDIPIRQVSLTETLERLKAALADRYVLERELGRAAWPPSISRRTSGTTAVALKVLRPELAATLGPERFLREIQIAAQLQHPHILPLLRFRRGRRFPLLRHALRRGRVAARPARPAGRATGARRSQVLLEVTDALAYAHARAWCTAT